MSRYITLNLYSADMAADYGRAYMRGLEISTLDIKTGIGVGTSVRVYVGSIFVLC